MEYLFIDEVKHWEMRDNCLETIKQNKQLIYELELTNSQIKQNARFLIEDQNDLQKIIIRIFDNQKSLKEKADEVITQNNQVTIEAYQNNPDTINDVLVQYYKDNHNIHEHLRLFNQAEYQLLDFKPLYNIGKKALYRILFGFKIGGRSPWYENALNSWELKPNDPMILDIYWLYINLIYVRNCYIEHDDSNKIIALGSSLNAFELRLRLESLVNQGDNDAVVILHNTYINDHWPFCDGINASYSNTTISCLCHNLDDIAMLREKENFKKIYSAINTVGYFTPTLQELSLRLVTFFNRYYQYLKEK